MIIKNNTLWRVFLLGLVCLLTCAPVGARTRSSQPDAVATAKSEFRGVWIQTAFQERYQKMSAAECKQYLTHLVDDLYQTGFNAIIFQIRPEGDAFYRSDLEPWSRFLTGRQGKAPTPVWDPMEYLITLCHERQMEFHAWLNPYRMSASKSLVMDKNHLYYRHPELFVRYQDKLYLNPGLPECRSHIREVVKDIVRRYDVDAIHMDDYFYPYPSEVPFDDQVAYQTYAEMMGFNPKTNDDLPAWRRRNVNILIKSVSADIKALKPWVRFGISPFGIYRNSSSWRGGSRTRGTQCYSDLYADVLLWCNEGWIDYVIPQLYWEIGHSLADYSTLVKWWNANVPERCHLYIGQSIERSLDEPRDSRPQPDLRKSHAQFSNKLNLAHECRNVRGNCFWYGYQIDENTFHVRDLLHNEVFTQPALPPAFTTLDAEAPAKVRQLKATLTGRGLKVSWSRTEARDPKQQERYYCVYKFHKGEKVNIADFSHLLMRTTKTEFYDYDIEGSRRFTYVVTAVDPYNNEGKPVKTTIKVKIK
jgi:uncharacterized lipoprotein YddW (UPF0748 family)